MTTQLKLLQIHHHTNTTLPHQHQTTLTNLIRLTVLHTSNTESMQRNEHTIVGVHHITTHTHAFTTRHNTAVTKNTKIQLSYLFDHNRCIRTFLALIR